MCQTWIKIAHFWARLDVKQTDGVIERTRIEIQWLMKTLGFEITWNLKIRESWRNLAKKFVEEILRHVIYTKIAFFGIFRIHEIVTNFQKSYLKSWHFLNKVTWRKLLPRLHCHIFHTHVFEFEKLQFSNAAISGI